MRLFLFLIVSLFCVSANAFDLAPWQISFQTPVSTVMERMVKLHDELLIVAVLITVFVVGLLAYVCVRFSKKNNPVPSKTSHNTLIEIIWTVIPTIILIVIGVPSMKTLYYVDVTPKEVDMTLKVVGHQWYWEYQYEDQEVGNFSFDSYMIQPKDIKEGQYRNLEVDNRLVLPVDTNIRILLTAADVIHSFAMPAMGLKTDTVPGKVNETWVRINKEGVYYGQCSELCGVGHGFMPIAIEAVSKDKYKEWVAGAKKKFALNGSGKTIDIVKAN